MREIVQHKAPDLATLANISKNMEKMNDMLAMRQGGGELDNSALGALAKELRDSLTPQMKEVSPEEIRTGLQWLLGHCQIDESATKVAMTRIQTLAVELAFGGFSRLAFQNALRKIVREKINNFFPTVKEVYSVVVEEQEVVIAQNTLVAKCVMVTDS